MQPPARATVIAASGETVNVSGRVACMVLWLARHAETLNGITTGHLTFHFGGNTCKPELTQTFAQLTPLDKS